MLKYFLIFALITATFAQSPVIGDTFEFNDLWLEANEGNQVRLTWEYDGAAQTLAFQLTYPTFSKAMPNIRSRVFLKESVNADHSPVTADKWIAAWPAGLSTTDALNGVEVFQTTISLSAWDSNTGDYAECTKTALTGDLEKKTCFGVLAFTHFWETSTGSVTTAALRTPLEGYSLYSAVEARSLAKWNFEISTILNRTVEQVVDTNIKTKVTALPCENCGAGCDQCSRDVNFKLDHHICEDLESLQSSSINTLCTNKANYNFVFGDVGYFHFYVDVQTRTLSIHSVWAVSGSSSATDVTGTEIKDYVVTVDAATQQAGEYKLSIPMAGPASNAGVGTSFMMKFVFKLQSFVTVRFLENMSDRLLAGKDVPVTYADINGFKVSSPPTSATLPTAAIGPATSSANPDLDKIYNLCAAIIALVCLTCICATVSNIIPMFKKAEFTQVPAKNTV